MTTRLLTVALAAGSIGAAGTAGFLVSEMRHSAPREVTTVTAVAPADVPAPPVAIPGGTPPPPASPPRRDEASAPKSIRAPKPEVTPPAAPDDPPPFQPALPVAADRVIAPVAPVFDAIEPPAPPVTRLALVVERDAVIGIRIEHPVSSSTARLEDPVAALVTRDVIVAGRTAIPAGSRIEGYVSAVDRGGKFRERARISLRFTTLILAPDERLAIDTETIHRDGQSPAADATSKIGAGAVIGGVLGAVIGGRKGAAIGGAAGAAGGTAAVAAGSPHDAALPGGALLTLRLLEPVVVTVDREP